MKLLAKTRRRFSTVRIGILAIIIILPSSATASSAADKTNVDETAILDILQRVLTHQQKRRKNDLIQQQDDQLPFVSLCFAQSLDGKLAMYTTNDNDDDDGPQGATTTPTSSSNFVISGPASMRMTHALRSAHDAILVGGRTLSIDNPRLSNRLWSDQNPHQPRPVVLDTHLRHLDRLQAANHRRNVQNVIVCCAADALSEKRRSLPLDTTNDDVTFLSCTTDDHGNLDLVDVLRKLRREFGIESLMVEGGPTVLSIFLKAHLFDLVCVTISPKIFGNGLALTEYCDDLDKGQLHVYRFDNDVCLVCCLTNQKGT